MYKFKKTKTRHQTGTVRRCLSEERLGEYFKLYSLILPISLRILDLIYPHDSISCFQVVILLYCVLKLSLQQDSANGVTNAEAWKQPPI